MKTKIVGTVLFGFALLVFIVVPSWKCNEYIRTYQGSALFTTRDEAQQYNDFLEQEASAMGAMIFTRIYVSDELPNIGLASVEYSFVLPSYHAEFKYGTLVLSIKDAILTLMFIYVVCIAIFGGGIYILWAKRVPSFLATKKGKGV